MDFARQMSSQKDLGFPTKRRGLKDEGYTFCFKISVSFYTFNSQCEWQFC